MPYAAGHRPDAAPAIAPPTTSPGLPIRAVLLVGFGLTAGIWLFAWYYFSGRIVALEQQAQEVSDRYLRSQEQISMARADVYRASILVRDQLLSPDPPTAAAQAEVVAAYNAADKTLADYEPVRSDSGRVRVDTLREEIAALRGGMTNLLSEQNNTMDRRALLAKIQPRRDAAIRIADDLQALNRNDFLEHQGTTSELYRDTQLRFSQSLAVALVASLGIALFASVQVTRLESRLIQRREQDLKNQQNLQRLSAKLIRAQEEERRSIARELHDEVGQVLTAVKVELALAQHNVEMGGKPAAALEDARAITERALHTVRDLSRLLHPSLLDDIGLPAALDWYIKGYRKRHGLIVDYDVVGIEERLSPDIEVGVYRIVQEALTNVVRHAAATRCSVRLEARGDTLVTTVADEGVGFDPQAPPRERTDQGLGLVGMRERVWQLGGTMALDSVPTKGTTLTIRVPLRLRADDAPEAAGSEGDDVVAELRPAT